MKSGLANFISRYGSVASLHSKVKTPDLPPLSGPSDELVFFYNSPAKGGPMAKKSYSAEQIIQLLREVGIHTSEGKTISQASRQIGVTEQNSGTSCSMEKSLPA